MLALALNATEESLRGRNQSLSDFTYARSDITEIIKEKISKTNHIIGLTVSGKIIVQKMPCEAKKQKLMLLCYRLNYFLR